MSETPRLRSRLLAPGVLLIAAAILLLLLFGGKDRRPVDISGANRASFVPIFLPIYQVEAVSGSHHASLLNLPLPNVGAPQVPVPVDINGDLLPDVTFAVNLIDAQGLFNNPPDLGALIAPNISINRLITAPILTPGGDPLRINLKFTVQDASNTNPDITVRFGYDTGPGGTIPPNYKAVVSGLNTLFNPITARIDTTGGLVLGLNPELPDLGLVPQTGAYEGPLTTWAAIDTGPALRVNADLRFEPMPNLLQFTYGTVDATQQITIAHAAPREIDFRMNGSIHMEDSTTHSKTDADLTARIDRLPRRVAVDFQTAGDEGGVRYETDSGPGVRNPDLSASINMRQDDEPPLIARVDATALPDLITANWQLPDDAPPSIVFDSSGQGIGAIDARVQNYTGTPTAFTEYVPGERQFASIQAGPGGLLEDDTLIQAHVERIRHADFSGLPDGTIQGQVNIGDGELPLEVHGEVDLRTTDPTTSGPYINATATLSPLPDQLNFSMTPSSEEDPTQPMVIHFAPSETMDIDVDALVGLPDTTGVVHKGDGGTAFANLQLRNVPTSITATMTNLETESRIQIDDVPRAGAAPLDVFGSAVLGPVDVDGNAIIGSLLSVPTYADFSIIGLPSHVSVRMQRNADGDLQRVDVRPCQLDFTDGTCTDPEGEIAKVTFGIRNWDERPADLPAPPESGPLFVTAVARGSEPSPGEHLVQYEATGQLTDIKGLTYIAAGDLTAARVDVGGNQDLRLYVDAKDIDINGDDPGGRIDVNADVRVNDLPAPMVFCFAETGRPIPTGGPLDPITTNCEGTNPFGDGTVGAGDPGPLTVSYDAPAPFDASADITIQGDLPITLPDAIPLQFGQFNKVAAQLALTNIPSDFTAFIGSPAETMAEDTAANTVATSTRVRTVAPGASNTNIKLAAQITTAGADCADPNTDGGAICADVNIDTLPDYASVLFSTVTDKGPDPDDTADDKVLDTHVGFHACDYQFFATTPGCATGTDGEIGVIDVNVRAHAGNTASVPPYVAPDDGPLLYAVGDLDDFSNFELQAGLRVEHLRSIEFHKTPENMHAETDIGNGIDPLRVHAYLDTRDATTILDNDLLRAQAVADVSLTPLPQHITFDQVGPGEDQSHTTMDLTASETSTLALNAEVRQAGVADDAECGVRGTYCASASVDHIPNVIHMAIDRDASAPIEADNTRPTTNRIHVDQTRFAGVTDKANIEVHAALGLPFTAPIVGDGSLFADLVMTGVPDHISMAMDNREVIDTSTGDAIEDASTLERFQVHTCNRDFDAETCVENSQSPLDQLDVSVRSFKLRPTDFPAPPSVADAPFYIGAAGRGNNLEAVARFHDVSEVQFLNKGGMTAATAKAGGGADFTVNVDIEDLPLGGLLSTLDLGLLQIAQPSATVKANVDITPFPGDLSFCMRDAGLAMPGDSPITFTDTCEQTDPFDSNDDGSYTDDGGLAQTPLSIGFDANTSFDVNVDANVAIDGLDPTTHDPIPQQRVFGKLAMADLPAHLALHFLQPVAETVTDEHGDEVVQTSGPFHGILRTPGSTSGLDLTFAAGYLVGADTVCEDPRPNRSATCVGMGEFGGTPGIENLPQNAEFFYNPDLNPYEMTAAQIADPDAMTNFTIHTDGVAATKFNKLRISSVNPPIDLPAVEVPLLGQLDTKAFIGELDLGDLPNPFDLRGTLLLTDESPTADFQVLDGPTPGVDTLPTVSVHLQNYLAPDPTAGATPPPRPVEDDPSIPTYTISAFQRGPAVKVDANIVGVQSFGLKPVRSGDVDSAHFRHPLGTTAIDVGFEGDFNIRAFVDLLPEPGFRVIGDVLIGDIPQATTVCVRGPRATEHTVGDPGVDLPIDDLAIAGTATWCDDPTHVAPGEGGLEIAQTPNTFGRRMDVDAFARIQYGGGSSVIAGRVDIRQMPQIIRARFGGTTGKDVEVSTYSWQPSFGGPIAVPDGINRIAFEAASFDLDNADTGYSGQLPYEPLFGRVHAADPPGGVPTFGNITQEYLHAAADLTAGTDNLANIGFHVRGQIGLDNDSVPSSQLQHLLYSGEPCAKPLDADGNPRGDYPDIPENDTAGYTCIRVDFEEPVPGVNPLDLDVFALLPGGQNAIALQHAGISDLPPWIQIQMADAQKFTDPAHNRGWRRPCPSLDDVADHPERAGGCMAPLLRFDQPVESYLFGQATYGQISDWPDFDKPSTDPVQPGPDFDAVPNGGGWTNGTGGAYAEGIRLKVLDYDGGTPTEFGDDRIAARAGIRLQIPGSLQVEQIQTFDQDLRQKNQDGEYTGGDKAQDMRLAFTTRDSNGNLRESIGQLSAMVQLMTSGAQVLLTKPCPSTQDILDDQATEFRAPCAEYQQGINLPGHVAMTMYMRNHLENVHVGDDDKLRSSQFIQIDGRISTPMDIGARFYGNGVALMSGGPTSGIFTGDGQVTAGTAEVAIRNLPSNSALGSHVYDPDFRVRANIISDGDKPVDDPDPSTFSETGDVNANSDCNPNVDQDDDPNGCLNEWYEFNFHYNVGIERAFIAFDMHPAGSATGAAKQLDAVIYLNTPRIGADLKAFEQITNGITNVHPAEISLGVGIAISPLDFDLTSHSNIGANLDTLVHRFITETIGGPDWLADIIGFIIKPITALIDAVLNSLPIGAHLDSDIFIQFSVNRLSSFSLRNNILHAVMNGDGSGYANFGPIDWYVNEFSGGLYFDVPKIKIPKWICWVPGIPCSIDPPPILLLGYGYADGFPIGSLGLPIAMDFRDCDAVGGVLSAIPFSGGGLDNTVTMDPGPTDPITSFFTGGTDEDFVLWIGTDPRMSFGGLLAHAIDLLAGGLFTNVLDMVIDVAVGPVVCNIGFFSVDQEDNYFPGINYSTDAATYRPGTPNANTFSGNPVPGQPDTLLRLPEGDETPPTGPIVFPPPDPSVPTVPPAPTPPDGIDTPLYVGADVSVNNTVALCGVHEYNSFAVTNTGHVNVATAVNLTPAFAGDGPACAAADVGGLEIRANTIDVADDGSISADAISSDIPDLDGNAFLNLYRATGSSGGTNAGVGSNGSAGEAGFQNYEDGTTDTNVYRGGPGSSVGNAFDVQSYDIDATPVAQPDTADSAGPGGLGGGTIVLKADTGITIGGDITANGGDGASNLDGACDADPDDNGTPGLQQHTNDNGTPSDTSDDFQEDNAIVDPPYEHTAGHIGSGGGAGGGIAFEVARGALTVNGTATIAAHGGSGGSGVLGAGGGGGGGAVKAIATIVDGVTDSDFDVAGGSDGSGHPTLCDGFNPATVQTFDDPTTGTVETGTLDHDGKTVIVEKPFSQVLGYGPFWWAGGAGAPANTFDSYIAGVAAPGTTVYVCAVRVPVGATYNAAPGDPTNVDNPVTPIDDTSSDPIPLSGPELQAALSKALPHLSTYNNDNGTPSDPSDDFPQDILHGTLPSTSNHCGSPSDDSTINTGSGADAMQMVQLASASFSGSHLSAAALQTQALDINDSYLYGIYTVAIHGTAVEELGGVDWAIGVDATRPNSEILSPVDTPTPSLNVAAVQIDLVADDILKGSRYYHGVAVSFPPIPALNEVPDQEFTLSGLHTTQCRVYAPADSPGAEDGWQSCHNGSQFPLVQPDGTKIVELRAFDIAGNVSTLTADVDADGFDSTTDVILDIDPPSSTLTFSGGTQGGAVAADQLLDGDGSSPNWYRLAPSMTISNYSDDSPSALSPYLYRFDNGSERSCANDPVPDTTPPDCTLPAYGTPSNPGVGDLLATGGHSVHWTAATESGNRYWDDLDGRTPTPMPSKTLYLDSEAPFVEFTTVPIKPDESFGGNDWFGEQVVPFISAIDQFGASGLASIEYRFGAVGSYTAFDKNDPPNVPAGENTFCWRVTDVAGNVTTGCHDIREDGDVPSSSLNLTGGTLGTNGWYTGAPVARVNAYDDNTPTGVGIDSGHFRTRVDNQSVITCDAPSCDFGGGLTTGTHLVHAAAIDRFGNLSGEHTIEVKVDLEAPQVVPVIGPAQPDGEHGWWHTGPYLTLFADDPGAGSGVDPAALQYSLDNGANWSTWTAPVHVGAGEHTLCWKGADLAGNATGTSCTDFFVDLDDPTTTIGSPSDPTSGWFGADVALTAATSDPTPGSGFGAGNPSDVCEDLTPAPVATNIAGLCVSVDGGPYRTYTGQLTAGEGIHTVRAYSIDRSGRRSAVAERIVHVDKSRPVVELRRVPEDPAELVNNWYRVRPEIFLRADDGWQGSGVLSLEQKIDAGAFTPYQAPFELGDGIHTVQTRATDMVGNAVTSTQVKVDTVHPTAQALAPAKLLWLRLLGLGGNNTLNYRVGDNLSGKIQVSVIVYDATGLPVRRISGGTVTASPGGFVQGGVTWDGKDGSLLNLVPLGIYYYRVVAVDEAGYVTQSGESPNITIRIL